MKISDLSKLNFETVCVHGTGKFDRQAKAVNFPIYQTSTFAFDDSLEAAEAFLEKRKSYIYSRWGNPTVEYLEDVISLLEGGEKALITSSGMPALSVLVFSFLNSGENIVSQKTLYGGTYSFFTKFLPKLNIDVKFVSGESLEEFETKIDSRTRLIFIETPANPTLKIIDIEGVSKIAKKHEIILAVDNTFATPYLQNPLKFGADVVLHSATKYIGGHGDVVAGILVGSANFIDKAKKEILRTLGGTIDPFAAFLLIRGLKTLAVRIEKHCKNAKKIANFLSNHDKVKKVYYPGLSSHPGHEIAKKQMKDFGGMISFELKGGRKTGEILLDSLKVMTLAVSLGETGSLITHPASSTHYQYSAEDLEDVGMSEEMIRLSVGIENVNDLIEDLSQAFNKL
ncbi:MAG: aminotransferase class I/II-fold pyridoxal phosphate-dependent enzyme [Acidobacteriota bacterium]